MAGVEIVVVCRGHRSHNHWWMWTHTYIEMKSLIRCDDANSSHKYKRVCCRHSTFKPILLRKIVLLVAGQSHHTRVHLVIDISVKSTLSLSLSLSLFLPHWLFFYNFFLLLNVRRRRRKRSIGFRKFMVYVVFSWKWKSKR